MSSLYSSFFPRQQGIALYEVLLASAICAFTLTAVMKIQSLTLKHVDEAERQFHLVYFLVELAGKVQTNKNFSEQYLGRYNANDVSVLSQCRVHCSSAVIVKQDMDIFLSRMSGTFKEFSVEIKADSARQYTIRATWKSRGDKRAVERNYSHKVVL